MSSRFYTGYLKTEPNMREEFDATMDGLFPEISKAQNHIIRRMKRTSTDTISNDSELKNKLRGYKQVKDYFVPGDGYLIPCDCVDSLTREPDIDHFCPICHGEGWLWDEVFIDVYKRIVRADPTREEVIEAGLTNIPLMLFYTRSSVSIARTDKIVELWTDTAGDVIRPYRRKSIYRIGSLIDLRSDNGKLEYWKLMCYEEQRKFLNGPEG